jgi:hypothetical protein
MARRRGFPCTMSINLGRAEMVDLSIIIRLRKQRSVSCCGLPSGMSCECDVAGAIEPVAKDTALAIGEQDENLDVPLRKAAHAGSRDSVYLLRLK